MTKPISQIRRDNLKAILAGEDFPDQTALSKATGISLSQLGQWLSDPDNPHSRNMGEKSARKIERGCHLPTGWMDQPAGSLDHGNVSVWDSSDEIDDDRVWVDRADYHFSAGNGHIQWEIREKRALPFSREFFGAIRSKPENCKLVCVRGDSMEPFLFNRDMMMVDTTRTTIKDGLVYAIYFADEAWVKQIFKTPNGLILHSYNSKYPDRILDSGNATDLKVIGEVVYRSGSGFFS